MHSYDFAVEPITGTRQTFARSTVGYTPASIVGSGIWKWQVRAIFPVSAGLPVQGPFSDLVSFTRQLNPPTGANTNARARHVVLDWQPAAPGNGVKEYRVQTSAREDFLTVV